MTTDRAMTEAELAIREALERATPGPWNDDQVTGDSPRITGGPLRLVKSGGFVLAFLPMWLDDEATEARANARLIAACNPEAMTALLAELDTLRARCKAADALLREILPTIDGYYKDHLSPEHWVSRIDAHLNQGAGRE